MKGLWWRSRRITSLHNRGWAKHRPSKILLIALTVSIVLTMPGFTTTSVITAQETILMAVDGGPSNFFGFSVAINNDGTTAVVGANGAGRGEGAAYVFAWDGAAWLQQTKLTASDSADVGSFGRSVALSGDGNMAVVGAYSTDNGRGAVYVFAWDGATWSQQTKLTASDGAIWDYFGHSVAISDDGTTAVVGAYGDDDTGPHSGAAYVFRGALGQQTKLIALDGSSYASFGWEVAISNDGNIVLVGARDDDNRKGAVYVFSWDGTAWTQQAKLTAADGAEGDFFGASMAVSGDKTTVVVGAYGDDNQKGATYVFAWDGAAWTLQAKLTAADGFAEASFGYSVEISEDGTIMMIGSPTYDALGKVYVYMWDGTVWMLQVNLTASDAADGDFFGYSIALSEDKTTAVVGAEGYSDWRGKAYILEFEPPVAEAVAVTGEEDTTIAWSPGVSDPDSELFLCSIATPPTHGSAWVAVNGSKGTYTPDTDYYGVDSFTYEVSDGMATSTSTVTVTVNPVNDAPLAAAGGPYAGTVGTPLTFDASGSRDLDGDPLQYRWDFDGDGTWDTAYSPEPTVNHTYGMAYSGEVVVEVYDGTMVSTAPSTATIIAPSTVTSTVMVSEIEAEVALVSYTLEILSVTLLTGAYMGHRRKKKHRSAN